VLCRGAREVKSTKFWIEKERESLGGSYENNEGTEVAGLSCNYL
jgi:hypothetical protein